MAREAHDPPAIPVAVGAHEHRQDVPAHVHARQRAPAVEDGEPLVLDDGPARARGVDEVDAPLGHQPRERVHLVVAVPVVPVRALDHAVAVPPHRALPLPVVVEGRLRRHPTAPLVRYGLRVFVDA